MKADSKFVFYLKMIFFLLLGLTFSIGFYYLFDIILNGSFVDWFTSNFMYTTLEYTESGQELLVSTLNWYSLKLMLLYVSCFLMMLFLLVVFLSAHFYGKKTGETTIAKASQMIHSYMHHNMDADEIFPAKFAPISAQMIQIKSSIQFQEQSVSDEIRQKNDLIGYLAHDLKTPLTSVIGYLSLITEASDMPQEQRQKYMQIALDKSYRLEKLIQEFFEITRYNMQEMVLEKEEIDLHYMLVQMADEFYPLLQEENHKIVFEGDEEILFYGDPSKLARVFNNLLKNAVSYSYPGTDIRIKTCQTAYEIQIHFLNQGQTIPPHKLAAIFDKFYRLDNARSTQNGGAGLGLAVSKEIITLHGGNIFAESQEDFTSFQVILPLHFAQIKRES